MHPTTRTLAFLMLVGGGLYKAFQFSSRTFRSTNLPRNSLITFLNPRSSRVPTVLGSVLVLLLLLCSGCVDNSVSPVSIPDDDIREAVFRYAFNHNGSGFTDTTAKVIFLALVALDSNHIVRASADPTDHFIRRFSSHSPPVRKYSRSQSDYGGSVYEIQTGLPGIIFRAGPVTMTSEHEAEVEGGYYANGRNAEGSIYRLQKVDGTWIVVGRQVIWYA